MAKGIPPSKNATRFQETSDSGISLRAGLVGAASSSTETKSTTATPPLSSVFEETAIRGFLTYDCAVARVVSRGSEVDTDPSG
jgi:hypothetical protein